MDQELKQYLDEKFRASEERTAQLIASEVGALHNDIRGVEDRLAARFDSIDARLKLQAGMIQAGARAIARFNEFAENSEQRWVALLARVEVIEKRLGIEGMQ